MENKVRKAIIELEEFFLADLPSKIFPMDRKTGTTLFRKDHFETEKDVNDYIEKHFQVLRDQIFGGGKSDSKK